MKTHRALALVKGIREPDEVKKKNLLTSVGIEPTTSGLDLLLLTPSGLFMASISTLIYSSEFILCSTICVPSATRHNIHMYPYFLLAAIHHFNRPRLSLSDLVAQSTE